MKVLSVGQFDGLSNTCLHRNWALKKLCGENNVVEINTSRHRHQLWYRIAYHLFLYGLPIRIPESGHENSQIINAIKHSRFDYVWIDKGVTIEPKTLKFIKSTQPLIKIISYSPDNMALRHNQSQQYLECIPLYDAIVTNKSYIIDDMKYLGAQKVIFVNNTFEPSFHYPREITEIEKEELGGDVGFVGMWEEERCKSILYLADHGIKVKVFGDKKWLKYKDYSPNLSIMDHGLFGEDYCKSFRAFKISLCFLRKMNFDQQTTRSVEIPACGGFMLAERTNEHLTMFKEGIEADYFSSNKELFEKCAFYLNNEEFRLKIAQGGRDRCIFSDYSNEGILKQIFKVI